jgi:hypothetical protein
MLSRRSAAALVNAKLAALGHDRDFITEGALDTLHARAGHEAGAFGAALGAVLFLAATEHAPRIESHHVELAVPLPEKALLPAAEPRPAWPVVVAGMAGAPAGASLVLWLIQRPPAISPPLVRPKPAVARPHVQVDVVAVPPKAIPVAPPPLALPSGPPSRVSLVVPAGDRETIGRFTGLAARLREAGFGDVQVQSINSARIDTRPLRHHVVYYFREDAATAEKLASALETAEESSHIRNSWVPVLVTAAAGSNAHPPGSIDVFAP